MHDTHDLMTAADAARALRADEATVRRWVASGRLPGARVGQKLLIGRSAVMAIVSRATGEAPAALTLTTMSRHGR